MGQQSRSEDRFVRLLIPKHPPLRSSQSFPPVESHLPPLCCDEISLERVRWCRSTPTSPYLHSSLFFLLFFVSLSLVKSSLLFFFCHHITHSHGSDLWRLLEVVVCVVFVRVCLWEGGVTFTKGPFKYSRSPLDKAYAAAHWVFHKACDVL